MARAKLRILRPFDRFEVHAVFHVFLLDRRCWQHFSEKMRHHQYPPAFPEWDYLRRCMNASSGNPWDFPLDQSQESGVA